MSKRKVDDRREAARVVREQLAREQRRRQQLWTSIAAAVFLIIAGATGWFIYSSQQSDSFSTPTNAYRDGVGFASGEGPKLVEIYLDFQCPACKAFETVAQDMLDKQVAEGKAKVVTYPVAILDHTSPNKYPTRAAAASACAADEGKFKEYAKALFDGQPEEGTTGPSDEDLVKTGQSLGLGESFSTCVKDGKYKSWVPEATKDFEKRGLTGTPSIFVDGKQLKGKTIQENVDALFKELGAPSPLASGNPSASGSPSAAPTGSSSAPATSPSPAQ